TKVRIGAVARIAIPLVSRRVAVGGREEAAHVDGSGERGGRRLAWRLARLRWWWLRESRTAHEQQCRGQQDKSVPHRPSSAPTGAAPCPTARSIRAPAGGS